MTAGLRQQALYIAVELRAGGIGRVARVEKPGIGRDASHHFLDSLEPLDYLAKLVLVQSVGELALVIGLEASCVCQRSVHVPLQRGIVHAAIEIIEVPLG